MTIEKAKKILGDFGKTLSDKDIEGIIICFNMVIEVGLRQFERKYKVKSNTSNNEKPSEL